MGIPVGHQPNLGKQGKKTAQNEAADFTLVGRGLKSLGIRAKPSARPLHHCLRGRSRTAEAGAVVVCHRDSDPAMASLTRMEPQLVLNGMLRRLSQLIIQT
jgi:hypothetical protein